MKFSIAALIGSTLLLACIGCGQNEVSQNPSDYSPTLIVADGATGVVYDKNRGAEQVAYTVEIPYPADGFIVHLENLFSGQGWRPLNADFMNPKVPTAHVTGWTDQVKERVRSSLRVHSWNAEWKNGAGDILLYLLSYSYPEGGRADLKRLRVIAMHIPKEAVDRAIRQMEKF
jgi:hypothetical protein